jgi:hypothetical protein
MSHVGAILYSRPPHGTPTLWLKIIRHVPYEMPDSAENSQIHPPITYSRDAYYTGGLVGPNGQDKYPSPVGHWTPVVQSVANHLVTGRSWVILWKKIKYFTFGSRNVGHCMWSNSEYWPLSCVSSRWKEVAQGCVSRRTSDWLCSPCRYTCPAPRWWLWWALNKRKEHRVSNPDTDMLLR